MLKPNYQALWDTMKFNEGTKDEFMSTAEKIYAHKDRYQNVAYLVHDTLPWYMVGIVHYLEGGLSFKTHLFNGDSLQERTVRHPAGYPREGTPPFTWEQSAVAALKYMGWHMVGTWDLPTMLGRLEGYNGLGYQRRDIYSPYLWSMTNHYNTGKFIEKWTGSQYISVYQPELVSKQMGAAPLLRYLTDKTLGAV